MVQGSKVLKIELSNYGSYLGEMKDVLKLEIKLEKMHSIHIFKKKLENVF